MPVGGQLAFAGEALKRAPGSRAIFTSADAPGLIYDAITVTPTASSVLSAFGVSVAIGVVFGFLPARKAARLNPIDALRYD